MEFFVVLICCAIAAALGFFIGAVMRTSALVTLSIENRKLREPIKSEVRESTIRNGTTNYALRDGTEITFKWSEGGWFDDSGLINSVVTIERGDGKDDEVSEVQKLTVPDWSDSVVKIERGEP